MWPVAPRPTRPTRPARTGFLLALVVCLSAAGCSLGREEPATVTLPRMDTTTTTVPPQGPDAPDGGPGGPGAAPGPGEPPEVAWVTQVGGAGDDTLAAVAGVDATVVAAGTTTRVDAPSAAGAALVVALDQEGAVTALHEPDSAGLDAATSISSHDDGGTVCGWTDGELGASPAGGRDGWCAPVAADGSPGTPAQLGGPDGEEFSGIATGADGAGFIAGSTTGLLPGAEDSSGRGLGNGDALAVQVDADETPVWARQFGTPAADAATSVALTEEGDGVLAGWTDGDLEGGSAGGRDAWVTRFDPTGNQRWTTQLGSTGAERFDGVAVVGSPRRGSERIVAGGVTDGRVDGDGDATPAGTAPGRDGVVAAFGPDGALAWVRQLGTDGDEAMTAVAGDDTRVYVVGSTDGGLGDLLPDAGPGGGRDGLIAAIDVATGDTAWIARFGSEADDAATGVTVTETGLLVVTGTTEGQVGELPSAGGTDGVVLALALGAAGGGASSIV